ncbi:MAG: sigma-70 family RNA polymerase sigma factor [Planctomycetes bacterium]|nr:sigma-70 family RNA polymerase sigma factor [Planctomycetota bacterium]
MAAYKELRRLAQAMFSGERPSHTLQATALVHEAWLQLRHVGDETAAEPGRFRRAAAVAMRRILIAHARARGRHKRGGGFVPRSLDSVELAATGALDEVLAVDEAIDRLEVEAPDLVEVVRLRFYAGLEVAEVAKTLGRSERSVARDWAYARTRLFQLLRDDG